MENIDDPRSWYQFQFLLAKKVKLEAWTSLRSILPITAAPSLSAWEMDMSKDVLEVMFREQDSGMDRPCGSETVHRAVKPVSLTTAIFALRKCKYWITTADL